MLAVKFATVALGGLVLAAFFQQADPPPTLLKTREPVSLGVGPTTAILVPEPGAGRAWFARLDDDREYFLHVGQLKSASPPGVVYDVYLGNTQAAKPSPDEYVGSINFFAAVRPGADTRFSFRITPLLQAWAHRHGADENFTVTVVPTDTPAPGVRPVIGEMAIVRD